jgi:hypothetical protein
MPVLVGHRDRYRSDPAARGEFCRCRGLQESCDRDGPRFRYGIDNDNSNRNGSRNDNGNDYRPGAKRCKCMRGSRHRGANGCSP